MISLNLKWHTGKKSVPTPQQGKSNQLSIWENKDQSKRTVNTAPRANKSVHALVINISFYGIEKCWAPKWESRGGVGNKKTSHQCLLAQEERKGIATGRGKACENGSRFLQGHLLRWTCTDVYCVWCLLRHRLSSHRRQEEHHPSFTHNTPPISLQRIRTHDCSLQETTRTTDISDQTDSYWKSQWKKVWPVDYVTEQL